MKFLLAYIIPEIDYNWFKYFSIKAREASKSEKLNSYGIHQPNSPNFHLSYTTECKKLVAKTIYLQFGWSILSKNSEFTTVLKVLLKPA